MTRRHVGDVLARNATGVVIVGRHGAPVFVPTAKRGARNV